MKSLAATLVAGFAVALSGAACDALIFMAGLKREARLRAYVPVIHVFLRRHC